MTNLSFSYVHRCVMEAVERVAASDPQPERPVPRPLHHRRDGVATHPRRLGDRRRRALADGVTVADVMSSFDRARPLRALGAVRLLGDAQTPLAGRPVKLADRLAAQLLGGRLDEPTHLRLVPMPVHDPGRDDEVALPVVVADPDAEALRAKAFGRPLIVVRVRDVADREVLADARLVSALENRPLVFDGLGDLDPPSARACCMQSRLTLEADFERFHELIRGGG